MYVYMCRTVSEVKFNKKKYGWHFKLPVYCTGCAALLQLSATNLVSYLYTTIGIPVPSYMCTFEGTIQTIYRIFKNIKSVHTIT